MPGKTIIAAFKDNIKPGIFLWIILLLFFGCYIGMPGFRNILDGIALVKKSYGYAFSFTAYAIFGGILPEILKICFISKTLSVRDINNFCFGILLWGLVGIYTDEIYQLQDIIFGSSATFMTICKKMLADELFFSPLCAIIITSAIHIRSSPDKLSALREIFSYNFFIQRITPIITALWIVWIPGVLVVYSMPNPLRIPVATLILCFWSMVITFMAVRNTNNNMEAINE